MGAPDPSILSPTRRHSYVGDATSSVRNPTPLRGGGLQLDGDEVIPFCMPFYGEVVWPAELAVRRIRNAVPTISLPNL